MNEGKGKLFRDSKFGNILNSVIAGALMYAANAVGEFDITPLPDAIEPLAAAAVSLAGGLLLSRALARGATPIPRSRPEETQPRLY